MVDIIPKQKFEYPLWTQALFVGSIVFLLAVMGGFFLLMQLQGSSQKELERVQGVLAQGKTSEEARLEQSVFRARDKFNDFAGLAAARTDARPVLKFLEQYTHAQVVFTTLSFEPKLRTLKLAGATQDFRTLQEQMVIFQNREELIGLTLSNIVLGERGQVLFQLDMGFTQ
ncbi:MAG: hypothetical protein HYU04_02410 [Candidatus Wildermuthbacteria bacterium]|nr:hypothetical protein [Candidatus Wildermuthbacteria bacterium]